MKKYFLCVVVMFLFSFINHSLAETGKIIPIKWDKPIDPIDLIDACPIEDIDISQPKPSITNTTGSLKVIRTDGKEEFYDNRQGQLKNNSIELKVGNQIQTFEGASTINFSDGGSMSLYDHTSIVYGETESLIKVKLLIGKLRIFLPSNFLKGLKSKVGARLESKMRVSATCVRGTDFIIERTEYEDIERYYLHEGTLDIVTLSGESKQLNSGDIATINSNGEVILEKMEQGKWEQLNEGVLTTKTSEQINLLNDTGKEKGDITLNKEFNLPTTLLVIFGVGMIMYFKKH